MTRFMDKCFLSMGGVLNAALEDMHHAIFVGACNASCAAAMSRRKDSGTVGACSLVCTFTSTPG